MTISSDAFDRSGIAAARSLWSIQATLVLAAITHFMDFGFPALVAGAVIGVLLYALAGRYQRTGNRVALVLYGLLAIWIIFGFGLYGGLWNHGVKIVLSAPGGSLPPQLEPLFMSPDLGSPAYEATWIAMGVASLLAAFFGYRFARAIHGAPSANAAGGGNVTEAGGDIQSRYGASVRS